MIDFINFNLIKSHKADDFFKLAKHAYSHKSVYKDRIASKKKYILLWGSIYCCSSYCYRDNEIIRNIKNELKARLVPRRRRIRKRKRIAGLACHV